ncbi:MAG: response regulator [Deltaproteobacteria bacterium]|nr:response regulator [Deltaproteobacteria bacterium]
MENQYEILVVDDSPESLQLLTGILMDQGYKVRPAREPNLALESAFANSPDLILLDVKMPGMDGFEVCRRLKQDERTAVVPVIFISALQEMRDRVQGFKVGGVDFITKPIQREEVLVRVNVHLTIHYLQMQLKKSNTELEQTVAERTKALRSTNKALKASLSEKEVLLREIYHRTKNNMQVICAMLSFKSQFVDDDKFSAILEDTENRIMSMALVHEKLYQSKSLSLIDLGDFIKDLILHLREVYSSAEGRVSINLDLAEVLLNIDSAVPCGLVINELLTNAFKHAFPEERTGSIRIAVNRKEDETIKIEISDNGIGMPEGFDFNKVKSYGLQIVSSIVKKQLNGDIVTDGSLGTSYEVSFKERKYKQRI